MKLLRRLWPVLLVVGLGGLALLVTGTQSQVSVSEESFGTLVYDRSARWSLSPAEFVTRFKHAAADVEAHLGAFENKVEVTVVDQLFEDVPAETPRSSGAATRNMQIPSRIQYSKGKGSLTRLYVDASTCDQDNLVLLLTRLRLLELDSQREGKTVFPGILPSEAVVNGIAYYIGDPQADRYAAILNARCHIGGRLDYDDYATLEKEARKLGDDRIFGFVTCAYFTKVKKWDLRKLAGATSDELSREWKEAKVVEHAVDRYSRTELANGMWKQIHALQSK
jgi:hypothetical protein